MSENDKAVCLLVDINEITDDEIKSISKAKNKEFLAGIIIQGDVQEKIDLVEKLKNQTKDNQTFIMYRNIFGDEFAPIFDGFFVPSTNQKAKDYYSNIRKKNKDKIIGAECGCEKHASMIAGENEVDFVVFSSHNDDELVDIVSWWQYLFYVPCIAFSSGKKEQLEKLKKINAEYILASYKSTQKDNFGEAIDYLANYL